MNLAECLQILEILISRQEYEKAGHEVRHLLQQFPEQAHILHLYAQSLAGQGQIAEAVPILEQALLYEPKSPAIYISLGTARLHLREYRSAKNAYEQAYKLTQDEATKSYLIQKLKTILAEMKADATRQSPSPLTVEPAKVAEPLSNGGMAGFCAAPWVEGVISMNGDVHVCCRNSTRFGNIRQHSLAEIWHGETWRAFRQKISAGEFPDQQCAQCFGNGTARSLWGELFPVYKHQTWRLGELANATVFQQMAEILRQRQATPQSQAVLAAYQADLQWLEQRLAHEPAGPGKQALAKLQRIGIIAADYWARSETPTCLAPFRQVNLISKCNARCIQCPFRFNQTIEAEGCMDEAMMEAAFTQPAEIINFFMNGSEFLFYPGWKKVAHFLADHGVPLSISTNGILLNRANIEYLIDHKLIKSLNLSIDAATQESFETIRVNANFAKTVEHLNYLFDYASARHYNFELAFSFVLMKRNYQEFPELIRLVHSIRAGRPFPIPNIYCQALENYDIPGYNEFYNEEHHSLVDRTKLVAMFVEAMSAAEETGIKTGAFYSYGIKEFVLKGCPIPQFVARSK